MTTFNRKTYFDHVRASLFGGALSQQQVDGQNAILAQLEDEETGTPIDDLRWAAYMLATTYHETAKTMWPIEEYGKGSGKPYGVKDKETGQTYYGRGFVQLTWRENYHNATIELSLTGDRDLEYHADQALDLVIASQIMFRGMSEGWFTNKKLGTYFDHDTNDPVNARAIINNDVSKNGKKIADYHYKFLTALEASEIPDEPVVGKKPVVRIEGAVDIWYNGVQIA
jgi:putative chitinase